MAYNPSYCELWMLYSLYPTSSVVEKESATSIHYAIPSFMYVDTVLFLLTNNSNWHAKKKVFNVSMSEAAILRAVLYVLII